MSSLDTLLTEVGPILASSQFTHPSFREVLAAKQCADEINSGKLNVKHAAYTFWIYDPHEDMMAAQEGSSYCDNLPHTIEFEPPHLKHKWKPVLAHMAGMLNEDRAKEFVDVVGEFHRKKIERIGRSSRKFKRGDGEVFDDLLLCAKFIGKYSTADLPEGHTKRILNILMRIAINYDNSIRPKRYIYDQGNLAKSALVLTGSEYVAQRLVDVIRQAGLDEVLAIRRNDLTYYPIMMMSNYAAEVVHELALRGVELDPFLRGLSSRGNLGGGKIRLLKEEFGGMSCLEELIHDLSDVFASPDPSPDKERYSIAHQLGGIFRSMQRLGFPPQHIQLFNDKISVIKESSFIDLYRVCLDDFAVHFKLQQGISLYDNLEKNKMQFWDYWMVYKPK